MFMIMKRLVYRYLLLPLCALLSVSCVLQDGYGGNLTREALLAETSYASVFFMDHPAEVYMMMMYFQVYMDLDEEDKADFPVKKYLGSIDEVAQGIYLIDHSLKVFIDDKSFFEDGAIWEANYNGASYRFYNYGDGEYLLKKVGNGDSRMSIKLLEYGDFQAKVIISGLEGVWNEDGKGLCVRLSSESESISARWALRYDYENERAAVIYYDAVGSYRLTVVRDGVERDHMIWTYLPAGGKSVVTSRD